MSNDALKAELEALRAKRKPAPTEAELQAKAEEDALRADIAKELRVIREEENAAIIAKYAPTKTRRFFDFDPDSEQPSTVEHEGATCTLYTRFVVRGANADQLDRLGDAITAKPSKVGGELEMTIDAARITAITAECGETCVVYPTPETAGVSAEQHKKNVKASLWHLGAARATLGSAAKELGEESARRHRSKS